MGSTKVKKSTKASKFTYVLRTCSADMTSFNGFKWPTKGKVEAKDWKPTYQCGNGLHGLLMGDGNGEYLNWDENAKWLVVRVAVADVLRGKDDLQDKCKFRVGEVVYCGKRDGAATYLIAHGADAERIVGGTATAGYSGTATAGDSGTATAGYRGTATAGDRGTATAGYRGTATAGYRGTATAGYRGTATAGYRGTATAGYRGTATAGDSGTATAGYRGTATAGDRGTATAATHGLSLSGCEGYAKADEFGTLAIRWWDTDAKRYRLAVGYVGEGGIEKNILYRVESGKMVKA